MSSPLWFIARMKKIFFIQLVVIFLSPLAMAVIVEVQKPCTVDSADVARTEVLGAQNVGSASISAFADLRLPFQGVSAGIHSIFGTPTGDEAIEILSDRELNVYGWCFEVDDVQPTEMPDKVKLRGGERIYWYYGFAHLIENNWVTYCERSNKLTASTYCGGHKPNAK